MCITKESSVKLKGFAALCIIFHHLYINGCLDFHGFWAELLGNFGSCNVVLFFTLAGYGIYMSSLGGGKKGLDRFVKIYIPYLLITSIWAVYYYRNSCTVGRIGWILLNFLGIVVDSNWEMDSTMWYMTFLFFWYIVYYVIFSLHGVNDKIKIVILFGIASFLHISWGTILPNFSMLLRMSSFGFPVGVLFAYISINCYKIKEFFDNGKVQLLMSIGSLFVFSKLYFSCEFDANIYSISSFFYTLGMIMLFAFAERHYDSKILYFIGENSYIIYLIHMKIINLIRFNVQLWNNVVALITVVIIITIGCASNVMINKIVCRRNGVRD